VVDAQFQEGDIVTQHIDGERRNLNSRVHTAGHLVSLSVRRLAEQTPELDVTELKASHYPGASFVEFKGVIDNKYKDSIQAQASKFVYDALPVKLYWHKPEDLHENGVITVEGMPLVANNDGKVRVVDIVGAGAYPCGGTHTPDSSFVGAITVRSVKRQKGISKISYAVTDK
jgi:Ser-tRNA(Ala) deacylase AlaX